MVTPTQLYRSTFHLRAQHTAHAHTHTHLQEKHAQGRSEHTQNVPLLMFLVGKKKECSHKSQPCVGRRLERKHFPSDT